MNDTVIVTTYAEIEDTLKAAGSKFLVCPINLWGSDNSSAAVFPLKPPSRSHCASRPEPGGR
jgi:hypothetical protein